MAKNKTKDKELPLIELKPEIMVLPDIMAIISLDEYQDLFALAKAKQLSEVFVTMSMPGKDDFPDNLYKLGIVASVRSVSELRSSIMIRGDYRATLDGVKDSNPEASHKMALVGPRFEDVSEEAFVESKEDGSLIVNPEHVNTMRGFLRHIKRKMGLLLYVSRGLEDPPVFIKQIFESFHTLNTNRRDVIDELIWNIVFGVPYIEAPIKQDFLEENSLMRRIAGCIALLDINIHTLDADKKIELISRRARLNPAPDQADDGSEKEKDKPDEDKFVTRDRNLAAKFEEYKKIRDSIKDDKEKARFREAAMRDFRKLKSFRGVETEASMLSNRLDFLLALPWGKESQRQEDFREFERVFESEHFGLEKVKMDISDHVAVRRRNPLGKGRILCFVGPPGVGKTSVCKSIARGLSLPYVRISLGGIRDEAEIRGHRFTYIGALPGRIMVEMKNADSKDPVFVLDEIDKLANDFRGDPASALLEVLDPEQNNSFADHYLESPFDLSKVFFICTANTKEGIPAPLRDRMDVISFAGYTEEEKIQIAKNFLVPKVLADAGLSREDFQIKWENDNPDEVLAKLIRNYTKEAGVRDIERKLAKIARRIVKEDEKNPGYAKNVIIGEELIEKVHGVARYDKPRANETKIGEAAGLAWTEFGGEILYVQAAVMSIDGKTVLSQTGQLGSVMREADKIALSLLRIRLEQMGKSELLNGKLIHLHIPEGGIPKDGPSAGITAYCALESAILKKMAKPKLAMTGEINLVGMITAVGGIKEKVIAAANAGFKELMLPKSNKKDYDEDVPQSAKDKFGKVHFVDNVDEAREIVFPPA